MQPDDFEFIRFLANRKPMANTSTPPPRWNPPEGSYLTKGFRPVRQQRELVGATQLRSIRLNSSKWIFASVVDLLSGRLISYIKINHHIVFCPVVGVLEFRLWRWNMTFLEMEMKELGRNTWKNTHNTRSLIRTPKVCLTHLANRRSLYGERV